jgi:hypothetical protein
MQQCVDILIFRCHASLQDLVWIWKRVHPQLNPLSLCFLWLFTMLRILVNMSNGAIEMTCPHLAIALPDLYFLLLDSFTSLVGV